ncbi:MAG: hypothetical protein ACTTI4_05645 [Prevotella fusca]
MYFLCIPPRFTNMFTHILVIPAVLAGHILCKILSSIWLTE